MRPQKDTIYHIYNRGNHKEPICLSSVDYYVLYKLIYNSFFKYFDLISLCIMPNHYHILVVQKGNVSIPKAMHNISMKYTQYVNKRYCLSGHLFKDNYQYKRVARYEYFRKITKYIRENPSKTKTYLFRENTFLINYYDLLLTDI